MDQDIPVYFTSEFEPKAFAIFCSVGALTGVIAGCLLYMHDSRIATNVLRHVNKAVIENYHPNLK